jgi:magnesium-transporting ATPase (P-type)
MFTFYVSFLAAVTQSWQEMLINFTPITFLFIVFYVIMRRAQSKSPLTQFQGNYPNDVANLPNYLLTLRVISFCAFAVGAVIWAARLFVGRESSDNSSWMVCFLFIGIVGQTTARIFKLFDERLRVLEQQGAANQAKTGNSGGDATTQT